MHKDMDGLHALQQIDSAIGELRADMRALDDGSVLRQELAAAQEELEARRASHREDHGTQGKREAELEKADQKRKELMGKAYGGTISNPKELETLEKEIASIGRTRDRLENELLALFDAVDARSRAVQEQEQLAASLTERLNQTVETHDRETARLTGEIADLQAERAQVAAAVGTDNLELYERIRDKCANVGVSVIIGNTCSACNVGLPVVQVARLIRNQDLERCESCRRLLWIEREPDTDTDDPESAAE
jgi:predicted  nucleic acid-binding Zn-ribbon protein